MHGTRAATESRRFYVVCAPRIRRGIDVFRRQHAMSGVLVVRPSSLGDIVYALALVSDIATHRPELPVDWVAEEALRRRWCALDPRRAPRDAARVAPLAACAARGGDVARDGAFRRDAARRALRRDPRPAGAGQGRARRLVRARHAPRPRPREHPRAASPRSVDDVHHAVSRDLHFVDALPRRSPPPRSATRSTGPPRWHFAPPPTAPAHARSVRTSLAFHATSRADKLWPEAHWRALVAHFARAGFATLLPWGSAAEEARSRRIADGARSARSCPPRQSLPELATLLRARRTRRRRRHRPHASRRRAAARRRSRSSRRPTRARRRRMRRAARARLGGNGVVPSLDDVRRRRGATAARTRRAADGALRSTRCCGGWRCRSLPLRLWWRGRREPGYRERIGERFGRYAADAAAPRGDVIWVHAVSLGETRAAAPLRRAHRCASARARRSCSRT